MTTGKFTAPVTGEYFFAFAGLVQFEESSTRQHCNINLYKNGGYIAQSSADEISIGDQYETNSFQSTLHLNKGDQIWLQINLKTAGAFLYGNDYTHFNGFLLEEDIVQSKKQYDDVISK